MAVLAVVSMTVSMTASLPATAARVEREGERRNRSSSVAISPSFVSPAGHDAPRDAGDMHCVYRSKKNAKPIKGCSGGCPKKKDILVTEFPCEQLSDCASTFKTWWPCPDGGPGYCKRVAGVRIGCR